MLTLRCTQRVIRRFRLNVHNSAPASSGRLGDWYANLLNIGHSRLVLCQSERSLLPVVLPARKATFPSDLGPALGAMLGVLGVPPPLIDEEMAAMSDVTFAKPRSRQVLGAMNDFAFHAEGYWPAQTTPSTALEVCLRLAEMPSRPIGYQSPDRITLELFAAHSD